MGAKLLCVDTVHKAYGVNPVLRGINLTIDTHEVVVLEGASGSGKSTLLRCINGLEAIDAGRIMLDGDLEVSAPHADLDAVRKRIGIVFQSFNLLPRTTALENVAVPLEFAGDRKAFERARAGLEIARSHALSARGCCQRSLSPRHGIGGRQNRIYE